MAYSKQTWHDLPDQTTPINAERLNHIEDGIYENSTGLDGKIVDEYSTSTEKGYSASYVNGKIELLKPVVLYYNTSGTNGQVSLNETTANYEYLEIFYRTNDLDYSSLKVYSPNGKNIAMVINHPTSTGTSTNYMKSKVMNISGDKINNIYYSEIGFNNNGTTSVTGTNNIYIVRVIGYKSLV